MAKKIRPIQCPNGHFYSPADFASCPYCSDDNETAETPVEIPSSPVAPARDSSFVSPTLPLMMSSQNEDDKTQPAWLDRDAQIDPVVGWVVCCDAPRRGKDYRLHDGSNYIVRDLGMDICLNNDDSILYESSAVITYNRGSRKFLLSSGTGRNVVYLNDEAVIGKARELKLHDQIRVGRTTLVFVPLSDESFDCE